MILSAPATRKAFTSLVLKIFRVNGLLLAAGDELASGEGISSALWQVMGAVSDGPRTVAEVSRIMGLSRQSVQRTANVLVGRGLCELVANPAHKKAHLLRLTKDGTKVMASMNRIQVQWASALSRNLSLKSLKGTLCNLDEIERILTNGDRP
jgi:DNA-binding MarR family transcriptional regulator